MQKEFSDDFFAGVLRVKMRYDISCESAVDDSHEILNLTWFHDKDTKFENVICCK